MVPLEILVVIPKAWKKEVFLGPSLLFSASIDVRIRHSLNKEEEDFIVNRRKSSFPARGNIKVKNIALLGSGGGQRAMVGLLGSLVELKEAGLLDSILYLSGVSGSTWCMASLYQEPDWSTKLETVKDKIIKRLNGPGVSWGDVFEKLKKYYKEKDIFSLTDLWAVMVVPTFVKEIDESTLTHQWDHCSKDPFPIYTVIDKQCKHQVDGDPWFEISPYEAGYSHIGAFVETPIFGSQFDKGSKEKQQPEIDMLYLQALCGSAIADSVDEILNSIWQKVKDFFDYLFPQIKTGKDPNNPPAECFQVLMDLVNMNVDVLNAKDPSALDKSIRESLNELTEDKGQLIPIKKLNLADKEAAKWYMEKYTMDVCNCLSDWFKCFPFDLICSILKCAAQRIWGRKYNFLHNIIDETVPPALLEHETRDYIDAGLMDNSPYFSVLREERNIDLIISLDFSEGDPFLTLTQTSDKCKKLKIHFPKVPPFSEEDKKNPKSFYVFEGPNAPTVIHIPLFNVVNCGDKIEDYQKKYGTFKFPYSAEKITELMELAGKNISNNIEKLKEQIWVKDVPGAN
ncbi:cytosolic phospholipase A2 gamma-like [Garra rufa]|uniref:cytosolic phospholipase A2 gamma-like n=1 Tax=Garra rufa TaxID=137080 RepID=UPI003CCE96E2